MIIIFFFLYGVVFVDDIINRWCFCWTTTKNTVDWFLWFLLLFWCDWFWHFYTIFISFNNLNFRLFSLHWTVTIINSIILFKWFACFRPRIENHSSRKNTHRHNSPCIRRFCYLYQILMLTSSNNTDMVLNFQFNLIRFRAVWWKFVHLHFWY